jgi:hypothetical protein
METSSWAWEISTSPVAASHLGNGLPPSATHHPPSISLGENKLYDEAIRTVKKPALKGSVSPRGAFFCGDTAVISFGRSEQIRLYDDLKNQGETWIINNLFRQENSKCSFNEFRLERVRIDVFSLFREILDSQ